MRVPADRLADTPELNVVRCPWSIKGQAVYRVEVREDPPRFAREGQNILSAVLIGMQWRAIGYCVGKRGQWRGYQGLSDLEKRQRGPSDTGLRATIPDSARAVAALALGNEALA